MAAGWHLHISCSLESMTATQAVAAIFGCSSLAAVPAAGAPWLGRDSHMEEGDGHMSVAGAQ